MTVMGEGYAEKIMSSSKEIRDTSAGMRKLVSLKCERKVMVMSYPRLKRAVGGSSCVNL